MTREEFEYAIKSCGCFIYRGQTYYEESEMMKAFEDMGLIEQEQSGDLIQRQAVLDLCDKRTKYDIPYEYYEGKKHIRGWDIGKIINMTKLMQLPSVKPQDCDKCEVGNPCLYCKHEFEPQERSERVNEHI